MASAVLIQQEIDKLVVHFRYSDWTIGVSDDPVMRRAEHELDGEDTPRWRQWEADTESEARNVEALFIGQGMKGGVGGRGRANFVYVF